MPWKIVLALCLILLPRPAPAFDAGPLLDKAEEALEQGRLMESLSLYRTVHDSSSDALVRCDALLRSAGVLALYADLPDDARVLYDRAANSGGDARCVENGLMRSGLLLYEQGNLREAGLRFQTLVDHFPDGQQMEMAGLMLQVLAGERDASDVPAATFTSAVPWASGEPFVRIDMGGRTSLSFTLSGQAQIVRGDGRWQSLGPGVHSVGLLAGEVVIDGLALGRECVVVPEGAVSLSGVEHVGELLFRVDGGSVRAVLRLPMELYIEGVVAREMGASFPDEALKAQAVAARSYAAHMLAATRDRMADLGADTLSQVYGGLVREDAAVRRAVADTRGQILFFNGQPALTYYHSHSGGWLEDDAELWNADYPFLRAASDPASPAARDMSWTFELDLDELAGLLEANGYGRAGILDVKGEGTTASGRIRNIVIHTSQGEVSLAADAFRLLVGPAQMKSTLCSVILKGKTLVMHGQGFGHGVGMSQWGASGLADGGAAYQEILGTYYPGVELRSAW